MWHFFDRFLDANHFFNRPLPVHLLQISSLTRFGQPKLYQFRGVPYSLPEKYLKALIADRARIFGHPVHFPILICLLIPWYLNLQVEFCSCFILSMSLQRPTSYCQKGINEVYSDLHVFFDLVSFYLWVLETHIILS